MSPLDMTVSESHPVKNTDASAHSEESPEKKEPAQEKGGYPEEMQPALILSVCAVVATLFSVFALNAGDWSIFIVAGYCLFMLFYPLYQGKSESRMANYKKEYLMLGIICAAACLALPFLAGKEDSYVEAVTIIMALVGIKLVFYPNYNFDEE